MRTFLRLFQTKCCLQIAVPETANQSTVNRTDCIVHQRDLRFTVKRELDEGTREFIGAQGTGVLDGTMEQEGKSLFKAMEDPFTIR